MASKISCSRKMFKGRDIVNLMDGYLNGDICMEILSRLPAKDLIRSKCVCKLWNILILDFLSKRSTLNFSGLLYTTIDVTVSARLGRVEYASSGQGAEEQVLSFLPSYSDLQLVDCQNGLLLLVKWVSRIFYVCNFLTKKWIVLPPCPPRKEMDLPCYPALAFDPCTSAHFKVILFYFDQQHSHIGLQMFSSEMCKWVESKLVFQLPPSSFFGGRYLDGNAFLNGVVHKLVDPYYIFGFNVKEESYRVICLPEDVENCSLGCLGVTGGYLHYAKCSDFQLQIWMLKDYDNAANEWILKHSIDVSTLENKYHCILFQAKAFHPDFDIVFLEGWGKIFSYHLNNTRLEEFCTYSPGMTRRISSTRVCPFSPCLYESCPLGLCSSLAQPYVW
ncbi:F-box protein At5g49610-like [Tasmannia lanceolata]|uniref:F-box protein At5g49610-like n=1 Tax=Tasmannia lanceolata TaxID=3420 RepID=UPI0040634277